jgi:hypothetical protein
MSAVSKKEKEAQDKARAARFKSNGEPTQAPGFNKNTLEPSDALVSDRADLLIKGKGNKSRLSGPFDGVDAAVSSIKSADFSTRTK